MNNDPKSGFWGILARKAKAIIEDEEASQHTSRMKSPTDAFDQVSALIPMHSKSKWANKVFSWAEVLIGYYNMEFPKCPSFSMVCSSFDTHIFLSASWWQINYQRSDNSRRVDNPTLRKGFDKITSSLNQIGDTFEKAFEVLHLELLKSGLLEYSVSWTSHFSKLFMSFLCLQFILLPYCWYIDAVHWNQMLTSG